MNALAQIACSFNFTENLMDRAGLYRTCVADCMPVRACETTFENVIDRYRPAVLFFEQDSARYVPVTA